MVWGSQDCAVLNVTVAESLIVCPNNDKRKLNKAKTYPERFIPTDFTPDTFFAMVRCRNC